jgi:manganese/zinc/iron transport system permease protein
MGFSTKAIQNGLVLITTLTIVAAFEAVGSILVVAFLAIPPATAHLLTNRVAPTILTAVAAGAISSCIGLWGAITLNTSVAGMVSVAAGLLFFLALLFTPHNGIVVKAIRRLVLKLQITQDDILGVLYRWHETPDEQRPKRALSARDLSLALRRGFITRLALHRAMRAGHVSSDAHSDAVYLTESGLVEARALVRSHRLWEAYLSKHLGLPADHLHEPSERAEHFIGRALARELQRDISTNKDPHGKKIP